MPNYIDGFVFPLSKAAVEEYKVVAQEVAEIYREHGAIEYVEFIGQDLQRPGTMSFIDLSNCTEGETVVFGWIVYESLEVRNEVNKKVEADSRMPDLVGPLLGTPNPVFQPDRMAFGGFEPLVSSSSK